MIVILIIVLITSGAASESTSSEPLSLGCRGAGPFQNVGLKKPYYIIDGTYKNIFLFSGSDKQDNDQQVEISKD